MLLKRRILFQPGILVFIHVVKGTGTQDNKVNNAGV